MRENLTYGLKWQGMETRAVRHSWRHLLTLHGTDGIQSAILLVRGSVGE